MKQEYKDHAGRVNGGSTRQVTSDEASAAHRRKLEAMFGGGSTEPEPSPSAGSQHGGPRHPPKASARPIYASPRKSTGRQPSEYRLRLERLRISREPEEIKEAADAFLKHHQLPDDLDVLYKVLQHPEEKVLRDAMGQISALLMQGRVNGTLILQDRLSEIETRDIEPSTRSYIDGLRAQVATLEK